MIPKFCEECPFVTVERYSEPGYAGYCEDWYCDEGAFFNPSDENCPRHEEYLEKLLDDAEEDDE